MNFNSNGVFDYRNSKVLKPRLREITPEIIKEIQETFEIFDSEKKNCLKMDDLKIALMSLGLKTSNDEFLRIVKRFKLTNGDRNFLTYQEFYEIASMRLVQFFFYTF